MTEPFKVLPGGRSRKAELKQKLTRPKRPSPYENVIAVQVPPEIRAGRGAPLAGGEVAVEPPPVARSPGRNP